MAPIDGFCAGEPWGSHAAERGVGTIALSSGDIWPNHPEKVLAFAAGYALRDPESAIACTAAIIAATRWLDEPENKAEAVHILQRRAFPDLSVAAIGAAFDGTAEGLMQAAPLRFRTATLPRREQAAWWLRQMRRWGHVPATASPKPPPSPPGARTPGGPPPPACGRSNPPPPAHPLPTCPLPSCRRPTDEPHPPPRPRRHRRAAGRRPRRHPARRLRPRARRRRR